jgi:hypothetical protein
MPKKSLNKSKNENMLYSFVFIFVILIILAIIVFIILKNNSKNEEYNKEVENYEYEPTFLNKDECCHILQKDIDNFYSTFSDLDLEVRKVKNVEEYVNDVIPKSVEDFDDELKDKIRKCIYKINKKIPKFKNKYSYLDIDKFLNIPWKIGLFNKKYECGLPHTRKEYIFLPKERSKNKSDLELFGTLVHEKIHVYQKLYPEDIKSFLKENNFHIYKPYLEFKKTEKTRVNSNPDIDEWTYYQNDLNNILHCEYNENPQSISDKKCFPKNDSQHEHPLEMMAIKLTNELSLE